MASCHTHATCCQSSHRIHRIHRSFWCRIFSHGFHRSTQKLVPLWGHLSPLGFAACQSKKCTNRADVPSVLFVQQRQLHPLVGGVGMAGMPYPPNLCASVPICGRHISARMFCVFCVFCGNSLPVCLVMSVVVFSHGFHGFPQMVRLRYWRRGYGRMPYPPNLCVSVPICGRLSSPDGSVCSAYSVGHSLCLLCWCICGRHISAGFRSPSDQFPFATRSDCVRCTMP